MKIDRLTEPKLQGGRYEAVLDSGERLRLQPSVAAEFGLYAGMELDEETLARIRESNGRASARARAVRILSASGVSKNELRRRLVQKGETEENAAGAVEWLDGLKLVNDADTARRLASDAARKGYGAARIRQILYQKGIPKELWAEAMAELPSPDGAIDRFLADRFRGSVPDAAEAKRAAEALLRRGHRWEDVKRALRRYTDSLDDVSEE